MRSIQTRPALLASLLLLALGVGFGALALQQLHVTTDRLDGVLSEHADTVIAVERLRVASERIGRTARSYLLTRDEAFLDQMHEARAMFASLTSELLRRDVDGHLRDALKTVEDIERRHSLALDGALKARGRLSRDDAVAVLERDVQPLRNELNQALSAAGRHEDERFRDARSAARSAAASALRLLIAIAGVALAAAAALIYAVARVLMHLTRSRSDLQTSHDRLALINRDLDAFAGRIAHDLRNLLAPLRMLAARLRRSSDGSGVAETAHRLEVLSRRSDRLIDSLLAFARSGHISDAPGTTRAASAAREAAEDMASLTCDVGATIQLDLDEAVHVRCPPGLLYTVVVNLLGNAVKFVNGRARRDVSLSVRRVGSECQIAISDTGPGIPEEWRAKVFAPFVRVPGTTATGSGIGLATVHRIVRAHGGDIEVRPGGREGTTFVVRLPVSDVPEIDANPGDATPEQGTSRG